MTGRAGDTHGLRRAPLVAFIAVRSLAGAKAFYVELLGLTLRHEDGFAVTLDAGGTTLRLTEVADLRPQPFTVAGWEVRDVRASVASLRGAGVDFHRYDGLDQDPSGVWTAPGGDLVAWFSDPDGNTLSLTGRPRTQ